MAVRTKRLFGPITVTAATAVVYTCPAGETAIIKNLSFADQGAASPTIRLYINGTGVAARIASAPIQSGQWNLADSLFIVLSDGDELYMSANVASNTTVCGFGAELEGVAD